MDEVKDGEVGDNYAEEEDEEDDEVDCSTASVPDERKRIGDSQNNRFDAIKVKAGSQVIQAPVTQHERERHSGSARPKDSTDSQFTTASDQGSLSGTTPASMKYRGCNISRTPQSTVATQQFKRQKTDSEDPSTTDINDQPTVAEEDSSTTCTNDQITTSNDRSDNEKYMPPTTDDSPYSQESSKRGRAPRNALNDSGYHRQPQRR
ncbi:hypothetical protein BJ878DRAFT_540689 [Calycina marina]|uniref:Uncharacterized protein n=1 Tax=Calycina marina TaxID=1763456 RepID=A0A9P7Z6K1_9HELO|nr:hypothetical protein BJ878DRAFT_540689 [Calycina marina]